MLVCTQGTYNYMNYTVMGGGGLTSVAINSTLMYNYTYSSTCSFHNSTSDPGGQDSWWLCDKVVHLPQSGSSCAELQSHCLPIGQQ